MTCTVNFVQVIVQMQIMPHIGVFLFFIFDFFIV